MPAAAPPVHHPAPRRRPLGLAYHLPLVAGALLFLVPLWWLIATSLKDDRELAASSTLARMLWVERPNLQNYRLALDQMHFARYLLNTVIVTGLSIAGTLLVCPLAAYAFARGNWPGHKIIFALVLSTMMLPGQVTMIPQFLLYSHLGLVNTLTPLWLTSFFGSAFFIFLLVQSFKSLPRELEEAAVIDGCGFLRTYWQVLLPQVRPTLVAVFIFQFIASWNDFLGPLIYIHQKDMMTLSLALQALLSDRGGDWQLLAAASCCVLAPVLVLYALAQRQFVEGIASTGLK